ncbi:MAG TPA: hypothetical protein VFF65_00195 [Phycisphaerales bacterium]|nr:hypothetical protein [Phycisphaerales bacterium]
MSRGTPPKSGPWSESMMSFRQRFGYFFIGAAFSCVLMGMYFVYMTKLRAEARREQEARQAGKPLPIPGVPLKPERK